MQLTNQATPSTDDVAPDPLFAGILDLYRITRHAQRLSEQDPVDFGSSRMLGVLSQLGPSRPSDIAKNAMLDLSTVSRHLKDLEAKGYVRKTQDDEDKRSVMVELTPDAYPVLHKLLSNRVAALEPVLSSWSDADRDQLFALLARLAAGLDVIAIPPTSDGETSD